MNEKEINELIDLYLNHNKGIEFLCSKYHIGKLKVKKILSDNGIPIKKKGNQIIKRQYIVNDYHIKKFINHEGKHYIAISKIDGTEFNDYENSGGYLTTHIKDKLNIEIPSLYDRRIYYMETGNYWWEQWFDIIEVDNKPTKKCPFCDWETNDIDNNSGAFENHLKKTHKISKKDYIKIFPKEKNYFKLVNPTLNKEMCDDENDYVVCQVCGKKLNKICNKHLQKHNMTKYDYINKYGNKNLMSANLYNFMSNTMIETNKNMTHSFSSRQEKEITDFIKSNKLECSNNKSILDGKELDIFIPSKNIAIEFNGNMWHSEYFGHKDKNYHLNKLNKCIEKGIKLIHIFEDEYVLHKDIVLNKLSHIIGVQKELPKIAGRKCKINEINISDAKLFLDNFHIQGFAASTIYLGAYYNNKLIAVMTFLNEGKGRWNLTRFASDYNYICQGVGGKLFKYFIRSYDPNEVKSFADRRWTINEENNVYIQLGFKFDKYLAPEYRYYNPKVDRYKRFHKFAFRKQTLHKRFNLPLSMSETEMTKALGYDRIWDCGLIKYIWKK